MVTVISHISANIFHMEHISAIKLLMGFEKNMSFLWYQNLKKLEEKLDQVALKSG